MAAIWTIEGEAGKDLDATTRTIEALRLVGGRVTFRNLATDTFTFSIPIRSLSSTSEIVPEEMQTLELFRSGVRFFKGLVTRRKLSGRRFDITVSGPWWLLERVSMESVVADKAGTTADRPTYVLPTQSLTTSLSSLLTKAIALGVPMSIGSLATTFSAPGMKLNQLNFAQAIAEVVRVTPDMVLYFDYSDTTPQVKTVRRLAGLAVGSAASLTLDARQLKDPELAPQTELKVTQVRVPYMTRATDGRQKFATQNAGTAQLGNILIQTVSGPELDTFLPNELVDFVDVQTAKAEVTYQMVEAADPVIKKAVQQFGSDAVGDAYPWLDMWDGKVGSGWWSKKVKQNADISARSKTGVNVPLAGRSLLVSRNLPAWAMRALDAVEVTISGTWFNYFRWQYGVAPTYPPAFKYLRKGGTGEGVCFDNKIYSSKDRPDVIYWQTRRYSFTAILVSTTITGKRRVYSPADFNFRFPPAGFATGLLAAQNYVPYAGKFGTVEQDPGGTRYMNRALNFSNSQPEHASARAMVSEETVDLANGMTTVIMGPPSRFSYLEFVNRFRTNSNDQIQYIV
jgi:hypothetical protein